MRRGHTVGRQGQAMSVPAWGFHSAGIVKPNSCGGRIGMKALQRMKGCFFEKNSKKPLAV